MANRFPLIVDTSDSNKIKELPSGDNLQLSGNSIIGVENITASGTIAATSINVTNITKSGTPLANVATTGSYLDLSNRPTLLSSFTNDANYISSGANVSTFVNDAGYLTTVSFASLTGKPTTLAGYGITDAATSAQGALANTAIQPGSNVSTLNNDAGYVTLAQVQSGDITIDVSNSGDLYGSVFGQNSTVLVDSITSSINLDGTIKSHVIPSMGEFWDIGSTADEFRNIYISGTLTGNTEGVHTGDVKGSVFADDSTLLVDGVSNAINTNGTIRSHTTPSETGTYDLGSYANQFRNAYISGQIETANIYSKNDGDLTVAGAAIDSASAGHSVVILGSANTGTGDAGGISIQGGLASGGGANGSISIGTTNTSTVTIQNAVVTGDLTGSVFADDSSLLVDGVNGKLVGDYENGTSTISNTRIASYDIEALQDLNTVDSYVMGKIYGGATSNIKNLAIGSTPPTDSTGADGDKAGMIAFDSTSIYYCIANWASPGTANIWVKQDWGTTGAWS
jgi:hypothetical protein